VLLQVALSAAVTKHRSAADEALEKLQRHEQQLQDLRQQLELSLEGARSSSQALADAEFQHQQQQQQLQQERLLERKMLLDEIHSIRSADDAGAYRNHFKLFASLIAMPQLQTLLPTLSKSSRVSPHPSSLHAATVSNTLSPLRFRSAISQERQHDNRVHVP
jgi:multidrug efflux pump subunit AcrA (membrane-fusion protein)